MDIPHRTFHTHPHTRVYPRTKCPRLAAITNGIRTICDFQFCIDLFLIWSLHLIWMAIFNFNMQTTDLSDETKRILFCLQCIFNMQFSANFKFHYFNERLKRRNVSVRNTKNLFNKHKIIDYPYTNSLHFHALNRCLQRSGLIPLIGVLVALVDLTV